MNTNPNNYNIDNVDQYSGNQQQQQQDHYNNMSYANQQTFTQPVSQSGNVSANHSANVRSNKIYIGNLNYELDTPELKEAFSLFGEIIDVVVIKDKESGSSRGFGFVTFTQSTAARDALTMHGQELEGRKMRVKLAEAKPQQRQSPFIYTGNDQEIF